MITFEALQKKALECQKIIETYFHEEYKMLVLFPKPSYISPEILKNYKTGNLIAIGYELADIVSGKTDTKALTQMVVDINYLNGEKLKALNPGKKFVMVPKVLYKPLIELMDLLLQFQLPEVTRVLPVLKNISRVYSNPDRWQCKFMPAPQLPRLPFEVMVNIAGHLASPDQKDEAEKIAYQYFKNS